MTSTRPPTLCFLVRPETSPARRSWPSEQPPAAGEGKPREIPAAPPRVDFRPTRSSPPPWPLPRSYGVVASRLASTIVAVVRTAARYSGKTAQASGPAEPRSWKRGL
jgi:hypothetical protein